MGTESHVSEVKVRFGSVFGDWPSKPVEDNRDALEVEAESAGSADEDEFKFEAESAGVAGNDRLGAEGWNRRLSPI